MGGLSSLAQLCWARGLGPAPFVSTYSKWASQVVLVVESPPAKVGTAEDAGSIPGSGRSPGGGHGKPLQYSCLENPMHRGAWQATGHRVAQSRTRLKQLRTHSERGTAVYTSICRCFKRLLEAQLCILGGGEVRPQWRLWGHEGQKPAGLLTPVRVHTASEQKLRMLWNRALNPLTRCLSHQRSVSPTIREENSSLVLRDQSEIVEAYYDNLQNQ